MKVSKGYHTTSGLLSQSDLMTYHSTVLNFWGEGNGAGVGLQDVARDQCACTVLRWRLRLLRLCASMRNKVEAWSQDVWVFPYLPIHLLRREA